MTQATVLLLVKYFYMLTFGWRENNLLQGYKKRRRKLLSIKNQKHYFQTKILIHRASKASPKPS